jgi:TRAP-type C4-dicarboxylate transport system substrate-binding protein
MKRLSILLSVSLIILLVISLVISCTPKPKEVVTLRFAVPYPAGDEMCMHLDEMIKQFNEAAGGEYQMKLYPSETLVKIPEMFDAVRTGAVEMASVAAGIFAGIDQRLGAGGLPFLLNNVQANAAICEPLTPLYSELYAEYNHKVINCYQTDGLEVHSKKPIKTLEDWNGLLIAAIDPECAKLAEILGAGSVVIPWTEVYSSLEKGVVDATFHSTEFALIGKLTDVSSFTLMVFAIPTVLVTSINMDVWNAMPKDVQDTLLDLGQWSMQNRNEYFISQHDVKIETLRDLGQEVYIVPKAERDKWVELARPYLEERLAAMGDFGQKVKQIADEVNRQYP